MTDSSATKHPSHGPESSAGEVFSPDQVVALDNYQRKGELHPFTCANRGDGKHRENGIDLGGLIPTVRGWICQFCDYKQDWAHDFMSAPAAPLTNPGQVSNADEG